MIELKVVNEVNGRTFGSTWKTEAEKDVYLEKQIKKESWGKNERKIDEENISDELRSRIIATELIVQVGEAASEDGTMPPSHDYSPERTEHTVKADYVITVEDITIQEQAKKDKKNLDELSLAGIFLAIQDGSAKLDDIVSYIKIKENL